jgi:hypothetical protein
VNQNLECRVTDRVTGITQRRGYSQQLEREKTDMVSHIRTLEQLLQDRGVQVQPWSSKPRKPVDASGYAYDDVDMVDKEPSIKDGWSRTGSVWFRDSGGKTAIGRALPKARLESTPFGNHLGLQGDSAPLSSARGTQLSILGTTINIATFDAPDIDEPEANAKVSQPLYNKSVQAYLQSTMNVNPPLEDVSLPSRENAFHYAEWYFLMIFPFIPAVHKPTFMELVSLSPFPPL